MAFSLSRASISIYACQNEGRTANINNIAFKQMEKGVRELMYRIFLIIKHSVGITICEARFVCLC